MAFELYLLSYPEGLLSYRTVSKDLFSGVEPTEVSVCRVFFKNWNEISDYYYLLFQGPHPNTYTLTKSIAEQIVLTYSNKLPISIVRPSIVTAAYNEPYPGWIDGIQGITGIIVEIARGTLSSILATSKYTCDIIPVDIVVNTIILSARESKWYVS